MTSIGQRIAVHLFALLMGLLAAFTLPQADIVSGIISGAGAGFSVYIGLICLIPRGVSKRAEWVIPSASGFLLAALWTVWGVPWQFTLIWGGALTWIVRRVMRNMTLDWEWAALPWIIICLYGSLGGVLPAAGPKAPLWMAPLLAVAGWGAATLYGRHRGNAAQRAVLQEACDKLEKKLTARAFSTDVAKAVLRLVSDTRRFLKITPRLGTDSAPFVRAFGFTADKLQTLTIGASMDTVRRSLLAVGKLQEFLTPRLDAYDEQQRAATPEAAADRAFAARTQTFRDQAAQLQEKTRRLPDTIRDVSDGIALATDKILARMREDPQDVSVGDRFLSRYLKAAHKVVDDYARLSANGQSNQTISEELTRSEALLERLLKAFEEEHNRMLTNDAIDFTAELNVLDKLLKMDGR
jgi:hypothetical protein